MKMKTFFSQIKEESFSIAELLRNTNWELLTAPDFYI